VAGVVADDDRPLTVSLNKEGRQTLRPVADLHRVESFVDGDLAA
jgi:hypothetical protein